MPARAIPLLALLLGAGAASAEIYRCTEPDGAVRFTGDPSGCAEAVVHAPDLERVLPTPAEERPAGAAAADDPAPGASEPLTGTALQRLLPRAGAGWEALDDPPETASDPELVAQGLRASVARHYTRARGPVSEVCTVELWSFAHPAQARAVHRGLGQPLWWTRPAGPLLVLAHGVRLERHVGSRQGLVPGCQALAERAHARASAR